MAHRTLLTSSILIFLQTGCAAVGPSAIREGRTNYNEAIHDTSRTQVLLNFVRVANHDATLFMDVTEVDAQMQFSGNLSANALFPQSKSASGRRTTAVTTGGTSSGQTVTTTNVPLVVGHDFSVTAGTTYQEAPTIRYVPLLGQPLVAQTLSPISPDSISAMFDSDWPLRPLLTLITDRLTPGYGDYYQALDIIGILDDYGTLTLVPTRPRSEPVAGPSAPVTINVLNRGTSTAVATGSGSPPQGSGNDALTIYFDPDAANSSRDLTVVKRLLTDKWLKLCSLYKVPVPNGQRGLDLRFGAAAAGAAGAAAPGAVDLPAVRTRSALGVLRAATHEDWGITVIVSKADYERLRPLVYLTAHPEIVNRLHLSESMRRWREQWDDEHPDELEPSPGEVWNEVQREVNREVGRASRIPAKQRSHAQTEQLESVRELSRLGGMLHKGDYPDGATAITMLQIEYLQHIGQHVGPGESWARDFYVFDSSQLPSDEARRARPVAPDQAHRATSWEFAWGTSSTDFGAAVALALRGRDRGPEHWRLYPDIDSEDAADQVNRHFIILVRQDGPPAPGEAFVDVKYRGRYYYVADDDEVSKKNLLMIGHLLTVQAVAAPSGGLTPTIGVGAH